MDKPLPVIAAIPNYNMAESLAELLPQVLAQGYDAVYVLDDASTDDSREIVAQFAPEIIWIPSEHNQGAGGARNKLLQAHKEECIIHFLDADVQLLTDDIPAKARKALAEPKAAFVGGLVLEKDGRQTIWNYGPDSLTLYTLLTAGVQQLFGTLQAPKPLWRNSIRKFTMRARSEWPDIMAAPQRRAVYWTTEGNLLIKRSVFEQLGGFDSSVHEYDIIPPSRRAQQAGLVNYFEPSIAVRHLAINVRHYNRSLALYKELIVLIRRHVGWRKWMFPGGHFKPRHNQ